MKSTWVIVADNGRGRIFEMQQQHLVEIEDFVNPAEREDNADLKTDAYGRLFGKGERSEGHTAEPHLTPKEYEAELFAHRIAKYLDEARNRNKYSQLYLIAAPKFLGVLRKSLDEEVMKLVGREIDLDLTRASIPELEQHLEQARP